MKKLNNKDIEIAVEIDGVYAQGFGMLAQKVMLEKELPLQSKAIYAYLASYAGSGKIYPKRRGQAASICPQDAYECVCVLSREKKYHAVYSSPSSPPFLSSFVKPGCRSPLTASSSVNTSRESLKRSKMLWRSIWIFSFSVAQ